MIKIKQAIIVEGKYDKIRLSTVVDAVIIPTNGFSIYKDEEKKHHHVGCAITLDGLTADVVFNDNFGTVYDTSEKLELIK